MIQAIRTFLVAAILVPGPPGTARGADEDRRPGPRLPEGSDALFRRVSPDGRRVGFVGRYTPPDPGAARRSGLFVVDLATAEVRQLIDRDLKSPPAWSPDSRRLAVGDSAGYGDTYPLAIVDVATGAVDRTGVQGAGPAWSPDGLLVAVSTGFHGGGSWVGGVPADGQIGLYDTRTRRMAPLTPPGSNLQDDRTGDGALRGAIGPVWSPDGRRIAFTLRAQVRRGADKGESRAVWVVDRDGGGLRRALAGTTDGARWSPDGTRLTIEGSREWPGGTVEVAALPVVGPEALPQPPAPLVAATRRAEEAATRARAFDVAPVLAANRAWQVPAADRLRSVRFVHAMGPNRLDERFEWRSDGAMLSEVVRSEGKQSERFRGRATVLAPGGMRYSFAPGSRYPRAEARDAGKARLEALDRLMGTRMGLVALRWGRDPAAFEVRDARRADDGATITLDLTPRRSRDRDEFRLHAGAMFDRSSWAYVHDLRVGRAELTVDAATLRIVREVDFDAGGMVIGEVDLGEWIEAEAGRSVPGRVRLRFPEQHFAVDDRFEWRPEGLWILRSGESRFDGGEPEREAIEGLALGAAVPELDGSLDRAARDLAALDAPASAPPEPRPIVAGPFALGRRLPLAGGVLESLTFTFPEVREDADGSMARWDRPDLRAVLARAPGAEAPGSVLLVLFDEGGRPVGSATATFPADRTALDLDLGRSWPLGAARSWSLTALTPNGPRPIAPAEGSQARPVAAFAARPGASRVVQVDAEAGRRGATEKGPTRVRSLRVVGDGPSAREVEVELVGRDTWKDVLARVTLVLLDGTDTPIAGGSLEHEFRVEGEVYDAPGLVVPLRGLAGEAGDLRVVVGLHTAVVGAPMGSAWGRLLDGSSPYPTGALLAGDEPAVWRRGLAALDEASGLTRALRRGLDPDAEPIDDGAWASIRRVVRPHGGRLAALLPKARAIGPRELARLGVLAGSSGDVGLAGPLRPLLDDPDAAVRDAAAIGLGMLGEGHVRARLEAILARPAAGAAPGDALIRGAARRALGALDR